MSRWDYDVVFYRVFCVTLLGVALTFTLILTNVFIDIDGLLSKKNEIPKVITEREPDLEMTTLETTSIEDTNYEDTDDTFRTKRSIETQDILFHIKNPKVKSILTNRLQSLLDSLDAEDTAFATKDKYITTKAETTDTADKKPILEAVIKEENDIMKEKDKDMLYLTVHNILLQGLIGHMDMKDVFKRVNLLMLNLNNGKQENNVFPEDLPDSSKLQEKGFKENISNDLTKEFIVEAVRRNGLRNEKIQNDAKNESNKNSINSLSSSENQIKKIPLKRFPIGMENQGVVSNVNRNASSEPNVMIKTTIEIKTSDNNKNETIPKDNIKGIIKVIYNGKTIKFSHPDNEITAHSVTSSNVDEITTTVKAHLETTDYTTQSIDSDVIDFNMKPKEYLNNFLSEYFKNFPNEHLNKGNVEENFNTGRHKRHVKIKFKETDKNRHSHQEKINDVDKKKKEDDELYVEIETHFDSKGMKGERKKKLIRGLIEKIQKAIRSDEPKQQINNILINKKTDKKVHIKKRLQNPLKYKDVKTHSSINNVIHRELDPIIISKTMGIQHQLPNVRDKSGETWKKQYIGPTFLSASKSINSAEMSELDVDINKVLDINGIPQRLQKPLNTDMSEETMNANSFYDLGNMKFFIKDIDGSGFSVGYNQYIDDPPDEESIKLFTGLENVIKAYHDNYDIDAQDENGILNQNDDEHEKPSKNIHLILRRSIDEKHDYHSNEYKIIYDNQFLPYENYKEIYEGKTSQTETKINNTKNVIKKASFVLDENIFEKNLKPAEIFSLANLLNRKKRSINLKRISNIKSKYKLNRYLNTKSMANKKIFLNKKRNKRDINKIRIIASDCPPKDTSDENIFVVSEENLLADRATVKEIGTREALETNPDKIEEDQTEDTEYSTYKLFDGKYRRNALMSKYPHIFMEEITRSSEDNDPDTIIFRKMPAMNNVQLIDTIRNQALIAKMTTSKPVFDITEKSQEIQDIVDALQGPKTNYKVTVKIIPKNNTAGINTDFKEVHTSINKSVNKNGLIYSSLVNVSEISKVTNVNEKNNTITKENVDDDLANKIKTHQNKMQLLLKERQKRINEQLSRLNIEKNNIESIFVENNKSVPNSDYDNMGIPSKLLDILHINADDANKLFTTQNPITTITTVIPIKTTHQTEPSTTIQFTTTQQPLIDNLKKDILRKMERNEHLTDEVLRKINKNTEILKKFLNKLSEKIDLQKTEYNTPKNYTTERLHHKDIMKPQEDFHKQSIKKPEIESRKTDILLPKPIKDEMKIEKPLAKFDVNVFPIDWRDHHIPFQPVNFRKNESHMTIPFVYTYQQPVLPKVSPSITSVVYHGHIHTIHDKNIPHEKENLHIQPAMARNSLVKSRNDTKFFIDDQLNDFKMLPLPNNQRPIVEHFKNGTIT